MLYINPTVDTESRQTAFFNRKYDNNMLDYYHDGRPWAATRLADIFNSFGIGATFFIGVNEGEKLALTEIEDNVNNSNEEPVACLNKGK